MLLWESERVGATARDESRETGRREIANVLGQARFDYGEGNGTPLQYSCLENPMDGEAWQAAVHGVAKSQTERLHFHFSLSCIGEGNDLFKIFAQKCAPDLISIRVLIAEWSTPFEKVTFS